MKSSIAFIVLMGISNMLHAQYDSNGDEVSRFRPGTMWFFSGFRPAQPDKPDKYDRLIFDLVYNDWVGDRSLFNNHWSSIGFNTNVLFDIPIGKRNTSSLGIGISHQLTHIRHDDYFVFDSVVKATALQTKDSTQSYDRSIFGGNSISIPIELRFRNAAWKHFKFHIGGKIGYQINGFNKYVSETDYGKEVIKAVGFPDLNKLTYSVHARIGLRNWALYGSYGLNTLFSSNQSSTLNLVQFGISISLF